jgi:hypothetical protein
MDQTNYLPRVNGYSKLASLMGHYPEVAIFRRFNALNARSLLYLQAELSEREESLRKVCEADADSPHSNPKIYDRYWLGLSESGIQPNGNAAQWNLVLRIRGKLKEYSQSNVIYL